MDGICGDALCISGVSADVLGSIFPAALDQLQATANQAAMSRL
ncbi:MAG: hypothetical protein ABI877_12760 [Gemmatimonadaceae bacterium]